MFDRQRGFTFIELAFGIAIVAVVCSVLIVHLATGDSETRVHRDKVFAYTTAQNILSELHAIAEGGGGPWRGDLAAFDDAGETVPTLSVAEVDGVLVPPDHFSSRNTRRNGGWVWSRRITVRPLPESDNRTLRRVTVDVFKRDAKGDETRIASLSSLVNSPADGFLTAQVFDIYFLALENVPGRWVSMEAARPWMESTVADLEARNPGLRFRTHWISKLSYGRNPVYRPYLNTDRDTEQGIPSVYLYPGKLPAGGAITNYYARDRFAGRLLTDSGEINGYDAELNPHPYALADFYNHAMRLPRERQLHRLRVDRIRRRRDEIDAAARAGAPRPPELADMSEEPTLRLLLDDLHGRPDKYRHALIVNTHGELLPLPPLRNYSDAAKLPRVLPGMRVVTHPEQLRSERPTATLAGEDVVLRVYAYTADPLAYSEPASMPAEHPITVEIVGLDLTDGGGPALLAGVQIRSLRGGVPVGEDPGYYPLADARHVSDPARLPDEMGYRAEWVDPGTGEPKFTRIWLYHTPVVSPAVDGRGLAETERARLYGLEYVPTCTGDDLDFSRDLFAVGDGPKNTARWTIRIPKTAFALEQFVDENGSRSDPGRDVRLTIRTSIGDPELVGGERPGTMYPAPVDPENRSETYTWWADSREDVPATERYQFLGDPRHNPYRDLLRGDADFPDGYNWYHDALDNDGEDSVADYPGLDREKLENRYDNRVRADLPRFFQLWREGLVSSATVYTTLTGWSYYYVGLGNEIGADAAAGYPESVPMELGPWGAPGMTGTINNITPVESGGNTGGRRLVRDGRDASGHWWGMPWLGELYPDRVYATQWMAIDGTGSANGNLQAGSGNDEFRRQLADEVHAGSRFSAFGTRLDRSLQRSDRRACATAFNIGSMASTFVHRDAPGPGTLAPAGIELAQGFGIDLPWTAQIPQPFELTGAGTNRDFSLSPYNQQRNSATLLKTFYQRADGLIGSGLVQLVDPQNRRAALQVVSGLTPACELGADDMGMFVLGSMVQAIQEAGNLGPHRIPQMPRVAIHAPTGVGELIDPSQVEIRFDIEWRRWDGKPYTAATPPEFVEDESLIDYVVCYSADGGATWNHIADGAPAEPGAKPDNPDHTFSDAGPGPETVRWPVPASDFPEGYYTLRVEAHRRGQNLHHAVHQVRTYIAR